MLLFEKLKEKRIYVILIIIFSLIVGVLYTLKFTVKEYIATSTFLLIETEKVSEDVIQNVGNLDISDKLLATLEEIIKSDTTASKIKSDLYLDIENDEIRKNIKMKTKPNTDTIEISVKNPDEKNAVEINKKLLEIFSKELKGMYSKSDVYIIDNAHISKTTNSISLILTGIISLFIGIGIVFIYLVISLFIEKNTKINKNIEKEIDLKKIIEIPKKVEKKKNLKRELISYESTKSQTSKAFKNLRSNIQFMTVNNAEKKIILVTSALNDEGKSYVSANMAVSFAEVGKKVILIDADMLEGRQNEIFNIPNNLGLSNYLSNLDSNGIEIQKLTNNFINETAIKNLNLITSGTIPPNTSELLSSDRLNQLVKDLSVFYDIVIIDGTSVLKSIDSLILARIANSTILVTDYRKTKKEDILKAKKDIQNIGGKLIGIIINRTKVKREKISFEEIKIFFKNFALKIKTTIGKVINEITEKRLQKKQKLLMEAQVEKEIERQSKFLVENEKNEYKDKLEKSNDLDDKDDLRKEETINNETEKVADYEKKLVIVEKIEDSTRKTYKFKKDVLNLIGKLKSGVTNLFVRTKTIVKEKNQKVKPAIKKVFKNTKNTSIKIVENSKSAISSLVANRKNKIKEKKEDCNKKDNNYGNQLTFDTIEMPSTAEKLVKKDNDDNEKEVKKINNKVSNLQSPKYENNIIDIVNQLPKQNEINNIKSNNEKINIHTKINNEIINNNKKSTSEISNNIKQNNLTQNSINLKKELSTKSTEIKESEKKVKKLEFNEPEEKSDNAVLVIVDAEKGCCRVFGKCYYTEKLIKGIDKNDGFNKNQYSPKLINSRMAGLMSLYGLSKKQAQRVDTLIYTTLCDYDDRIWLDKKMISNRADTYVLSMAKEYTKSVEETKEEYLIRCKRLRKETLQDEEIDIEYKLDNMWKSDKLSLLNKITMKRYANIYEVKESQKNYEEIEKSNQNKNFYIDIIQKVKSKLETNNDPDNNMEETENSGVYELEEGEEKISEIAWKKEERRRKREERREKLREKIREKKDELLQKRYEKNIKQEEAKRKKEEEKERLREEARIEEELLGDNLYPKTKNNRSLQ